MTILRIHEDQCPVCGYDGMPGNVDLALEAAYVMWHAAGGPASGDNGLALCAFHHKTLDRGALGIDEHHRILVSEHVRGGERVDDWLLRFVVAGGMPPSPVLPSA